MASEKFRQKLGDVSTIIRMRRNKPTNKFKNAVPGGLLLGPRFRLSFPMSKSRLADCATFRVACFPLDFGLGLAF